MPRFRLTKPATLVRGAAEALKIPLDVLPIPGKMLISKGVDAAAAVVVGKLNQSQLQSERREVFGAFETAIAQTNATVIRAKTWTRRVINRYPDGAGPTVQVSPSLAKDYREIRGELLEDLDAVESATLNLAPYLTENERGLLSGNLSDLRGVIHETLCPEDEPEEMTVQTAEGRLERLQRVGAVIQAAVEGLRR